MKIRCTNPSLLIYLVLVYALPALLNALLEYESEIYVSPENSFETWAYGGLLFAITAAFAFRIDSNLGRSPMTSPILWEVPRRKLAGLLFLIMGVGVIGVASGLSSWRYSSEGLSTKLNPIILLFVLAPNVLELILFALLFFYNDLTQRINRIFIVMLTVCLALTASGIGPMISVLMALVFAISPLTVRNLLLKVCPTGRYLRIKRMGLSPFVLVPLIGALGVLAYTVGDAVKTGSNLKVGLMSWEEIHSFLYYALGRFSVHWYSTCAALHHMVELGLGNHLSNLMAPIENAGFRFSSLTGGWLEIERTLNASLSRINYNLVTRYPFNDREGTSPGLIAAFVLAFPVWLGPFALTGYLWFYNKVQAGLRRRFAGRLTLFGELMFLYFTAIFFHTPVDFLQVFDPILLSLITLCYLGLSTKNKSLHYAAV
jgi:hypothetical protein